VTKDLTHAKLSWALGGAERHECGACRPPDYILVNSGGIFLILCENVSTPEYSHAKLFVCWFSPPLRNAPTVC